MLRLDRTWTFAFLASLALHALLVASAARVFVGSSTVALPRESQAATKLGREMPIITRFSDFGEHDGIGSAINAADGPVTLAARMAPQDQALLSRDPIGAGKIGDEPSMSVLPEGSSPALEALPPMPAGVPRHPVLSSPALDSAVFGSAPRLTEIGTPHVTPRSPHALAQAIKRLNPAAKASRSKPADQSGAPAPPADPAPMSDSESDAFTQAGAIEFHDGRMTARLGRAFRSVRPKLSLAAQLDLMGMASPRIVLKVSIDGKGKVTDVEVLESTGSAKVDQPVTVAMYQWWFEPARGAGGKSVDDVLIIPISWH
jgi:TonB family protein